MNIHSCGISDPTFSDAHFPTCYVAANSMSLYDLIIRKIIQTSARTQNLSKTVFFPLLKPH